jgi:hypothetical protein
LRFGVRAPPTCFLTALRPSGRLFLVFLSWRFLVMATSWFNRLLKRTSQPAKRRRPARRLALEQLEARELMTATFTPDHTFFTPPHLPDVALSKNSSNPVETQVAVNPVDPRQIAVTTQTGIRVSPDNGATFTPGYTEFPTTSDGQSIQPGGDPGLVADSAGRLFWLNIGDFPPFSGATPGVFITQVDPATSQPIPGTSHIVFQGDADKDFLAVRPVDNTLYACWTLGGQAPAGVPQNLSKIMVSRSTDQGATWSTPLRVDQDGDGFVEPSSITVDGGGNVYVAYHSQTGFTTPPNPLLQRFGNPDGKSGQTVVVRYDNALTPASARRTVPFGPGQSDVTFNFSQDPGNIPGADFITIGSAQPWVLADPARPGNIYVIVAQGNDINGVSSHILIARSTDSGAHWARSFVDVGAPIGGTGPLSFQLFPTAAIDQQGNLVVAWYDNRRNLVDGVGHYLLDVYATYSTDGGQTWAPDFQVNDPTNPFTPDAEPGTPEDGRGFRIGEYFGLTASNGTAYVAWHGNTFDQLSNQPSGHQVWFNSFPIVRGSLTVNSTGLSASDIVIRSEPTNPNLVQVFEHGTGSVPSYTGLWSGLTSITVNAGDGDHVDIENIVNGVQVMVNAASFGSATPVVVDVSQGLQDLGNIQGPLTLNSTVGSNKVVFHDNNNKSFTTNYSLEGTPANPILRRDLAALISYSGFSKVEIDALRLSPAATATDHFVIQTTPQFSVTTIIGNFGGSDQYFVHGTASGTALIIDPGIGSNSISIGNPSGTTSTINTIQGPVVINSVSTKDTVFVGDQSNPPDSRRGYALRGNTLTRTASPVPVPPITFNGVTNRFFNLSGPITVVDTPAGTNTTIRAPGVGLGQGTLQPIQGTVTIDNASGNLPPADVQLDDSNDMQGQTVTIGSSSITRQSAPSAPINLTAASVGHLTYNGGGGGSTYTISGTPDSTSLMLTEGGPDIVNVQATAAGTMTTIFGGSGPSETFNLGSSSNPQVTTLDGIQGLLEVLGRSGSSNTLKINDQGAPLNAQRAVTITPTGFTRSLPNSPATTTVLAFGVQNEVFNVTGATTVQGTASGTSTTIDVFGSPTAGSPTLNLGQLDANGNGTLQNIQGTVTILSTLPPGTPTNPNLLPDVVLNDFKDTAVHNVFILPTEIINLAPAPIILSAASVRVVEIGGSINTTSSTPGIPPGSMYTIEGTPAAELLQLAAFGPDTVNVQAVAPGIPNFPTTTAILGGNGGNHIFNVGSTNDATSTLDGILGLLNVNGSATDMLNVNDQGSTTQHIYTITQGSPTSTFTRMAPGTPTVTINFSGIPTQNQHFNEGPKLGNPAQAAELSFPSTIEAGHFATLSGRLVGTGELSLSVDWGDGNPAEQSTPDRRPFSMKHKYAQPGTYHVRAVWTDSAGQSGFRELTITVEPVGHGGEGDRPGPADRGGDGASRLDRFFRALGNGDGADVLEGGAGRDLFFAALGDALVGRKKHEVLVGLGGDR